MNDDYALLQRDLHWRSMPGDRRRPAGSNAITAIGLVLTLVQWGITAVVLGPMFDGPPGGDVIEPSAIAGFFVFGIEMFVAAVLAGRVWVAIGPRARSVLRPIGVFGPIPMLIIAFFAALWVVSFVAAPFLPKPPAPVTSGRNWRLADTGLYGVTYEQAVELCGKTGERVPAREDVAAFDPPYAAGTPVWLEKRQGERDLVSLTAEGSVTILVTRDGQSLRRNVVCFRP
jgi:hypothetical protein